MLRDATAYTFINDVLIPWDIPYSYNKSDGEIELYGTRVLLRSADNPDRLRGPNLSWAWLDEAAQMRAAVWDIVIGRLRLGKPKAWVTTTPAGFNWVYQKFVEKGDPNYYMVQARTAENKYLPTEYVQSLVDSYSGEFARQELEGDFVAFEGLVYDEFRRDTHVIEPFSIPESWRRVRAVDYGYTNPFVCLWGAIDEDGRLYIYDEHYQAKTLLRVHADAIRQRQGNFEFTVADHDAQDNAEMWSLGIETQRAKKDVTPGISRVKARLRVQGDGKPRLFLCSNCTNLIKEIQGYRWQEAKDGANVKEEPVKDNDHAMDALRYMVIQLDGGAEPRISII